MKPKTLPGDRDYRIACEQREEASRLLRLAAKNETKAIRLWAIAEGAGKSRLGGIARTKNLSPERLSEIGRYGANVRWHKETSQ